VQSVEQSAEYRLYKQSAEYSAQGDMTAEEIFNMFFGGGMPGSRSETRY
jgi:hypothetical protein